MFSSSSKIIAVTRFIIISCVIAFASVAHAATVSYALNGVTLSDGSELTGSFTVDWNALPHEQITALSFTHTAGTTNSTGGYITYDPILGVSYPWAPLSGQTFESTFDLSSGFALTYEPTLNYWTLSNDNISKTGLDKWQILYLDFYADSGDLFLDQIVNGVFLYGSRLNDYVTSTAKDTWATINGGSLTASPVPVPAAVWLFGSGLMGLIGFSKRRKTA